MRSIPMDIYNLKKNHVLKFFTLIFAGALFIALSGCAQYQIAVNTFSDKTCIPSGFPQNSSFAVSLSSSKEDDVMLMKEVSYKISRELEYRGYQVTSAEDANYLVTFHLDMTSAIEKSSTPVFLPDQAATTKKTITTSWKKGGLDQPYVETTEQSGTTIYTPEERTIFTKEIAIQVYQNHPREQVWSGKAHTKGQDEDLRDAVDYLLASLFDYFGSDTKKTVHLKKTSDDPSVIKFQSDI